ncbi:MAG: hypothetical protein ACOCPZ_02335 [Natrialbaceae archaeon]
MSWTHSSKVVAIGLLLVVALGAAGTAAAVSFSADDPEASQVGDTVEYEIEMTEAFTDQPDQWTLEAETELENASWQIVATDVSGDEVARSDTDEIDLDSEDGVDTVTIEVQGDVPEISEYNYEDPDAENYLLVGLSQADGPSLEEWEAHRYTEDSQQARQAIDDATDRVGEDNDDLESAIALYNSGDFEQATSEAESIREDAESQQQTTQYLMFGGGAVAVILVLGGAYYVYQGRKQNTNKLQ